MGDLGNRAVHLKMEVEELEAEKLLKGISVLDFDLLCSTVAQGKWQKQESGEFDAGGDTGGVFRMWEGEILDCFDHRRIAVESLCCPWYRFGKNMRRAGFRACCIQGSVYFIIALAALFSFIAFIVTRRRCYLYIALGFTVSIGMYSGFFRRQIRNKFNIKGSESSLDDFVYHITCPCCALSQEARTLEINNVQDGVRHGRGETICIGSSINEGKNTFFQLDPPSIVSTKSHEIFAIRDATGNC